MARRQAKALASEEQTLTPVPFCWECMRPTRVVYHGERRILHLRGMCRYFLVVRRCQNRACPRYQVSVRPEQEGALALPQGECGLDVIALVGQLRFAEHRSIPEIHQALQARELRLAQRTVTNLVHRYEELLALRVADPVWLAHLQHWRRQQRVVLAIDGLQPDQGQEVLWVLRDVLSGTVLLARSLLGARAADLVPLLQEVAAALPVPITAVISDGQQAIRNAVQTALPGIPHQLCQFHYLRQAAKPVAEADRHAKKELKKRVRGVRPIERALEARTDAEAAAVRGYCLAVRSALTDAGHPPLALPGVQLHERLSAIDASLERVVAKGGPVRS
jgi:Transposase, Mutator family